MPTPTKKPVTPKTPATAKPKAPPVAQTKPVVARKTVAAAKPAAPAPAPKPVAAKAAPIAEVAVAEPAPAPVPVIIAEPAAPPAPAKLTLVATVAPSHGKTMSAASVMKGYEDLTTFGKDNFDALVKANAVFTKGLEDFGKEVLGLAQAHMEDAAHLAKAMLHAKTLKEVVEVHTTLTKTSIEKLVADSSKLSELGRKVASEAMAPINARVTVAVEKIRALSAA